jgi:hypothetical protein
MSHVVYQIRIDLAEAGPCKDPKGNRDVYSSELHQCGEGDVSYWRFSMWQSIATAPYDVDLELAVIDQEGAHGLVFACQRGIRAGSTPAPGLGSTSIPRTGDCGRHKETNDVLWERGPTVSRIGQYACFISPAKPLVCRPEFRPPRPHSR